jgi:hypothetical protein
VHRFTEGDEMNTVLPTGVTGRAFALATPRCGPARLDAGTVERHVDESIRAAIAPPSQRDDR